MNIPPDELGLDRRLRRRIRPFEVPTFVLVNIPLAAGDYPHPFSLRNLNAETIDVLCRDFRAAVFAKAGKQDPAAAPEVQP